MDYKKYIKDRLQLKEGTEVEFKSAKGGFPGSFWETFSAFANTQGGIIVLGVKEKKGRFTPDGLTDEQIVTHKKIFWDNAHNKSCVNIPLLTEQDIQEIETGNDGRLLLFIIPKAPYYLCPVYLTLNPFGHTYKRYHEGDYICSDDEVRQMFSDANNLQHSADSRILKGYSFNDIDLPTLRNYRQAYKNRHENHPWNNLDDQRFLESVGAYRRDRATGEEGYTVAGLLLFGKTESITDPECCPHFFPDYRERLGESTGIRWTNRIYPDDTWEANLYQFFTRVLPMLQHALPVPFRLDENQHRIDTTSAHTALREALVNCLVHCAYTVIGNIVVERFDDRIVMSNPGTMLVSMDEFWEGGHSVCRNPVIQKMFVFIGVGEKAGSGADIIRAGWHDNGWQQPSLHEHQIPARVETTLLIKDLLKQMKHGTNGSPETEMSQKTPQKDLMSQKTMQEEKMSQKMSQKTMQEGKLSQKIIELIRNNGTISTQEMAKIIGVDRRTIARHIKKMQAQDIVRRVGPDKGGHWEIIHKANLP